MPGLANTFGIAMRNFTAFPELPDATALVEYGVRMEELGFDSLWVWDHILLGVEPHFPIIDALSLLTAVARAHQAHQARHRHPRAADPQPRAARQAALLDRPASRKGALSSAWRRAGTSASSIRSACRSRSAAGSWTRASRSCPGSGREDLVAGDYPPYHMKAAVMFPKPYQRPRPPILIGGYVDRVLKRAAIAADGWLTYFYTPESFAKSWSKVCDFAAEAGKDPGRLLNGNQLPIMVGKSRAAIEAPMMEWLTKEWDYASWSKSTKDSAIMGTVDECVAQLEAQLKVGVQKIIFVPYQYRLDQVEIIAKEIIPRLRS